MHQNYSYNEQPTSIIFEASAYLQAGWSPIRLLPRSKKPASESHEASTITLENLHTLSPSDSIGVRFNADQPLRDIDHDWKASADLSKEVGLTDATASFGRESVGVTHLLYDSPGCAAKKFKLPDGNYPKPLPQHDNKPCLIVCEIRGATNTYTMFPPSVHPDTGEVLSWHGNRREPKQVSSTELRSVIGLHAFASVVLYFYPENADSRYEVRMALAGALLRAGVDERRALLYARGVASLAGDPKWEEDFIEHTQARLTDERSASGIPKLVEVLQLPEACEKMFREWLQFELNETVSSTDARQVIRVKRGETYKAWRETQKAMIRAKCQVFVRAGSLVEPLWRWEKTAETDRDVLAVALVKYNPQRLADQVARNAAVFQKFDERAGVWKPIDPPKDVIETLLERGDWDFPTITGVVNTPTMRRDGSLVTQPGYDALTQLWYKPGADIELPSVLDRPSKADAEGAVALLSLLIEEFPFVADVDRSVALAALMTVVLRGAFEVAPLFFIHKPEAGTRASYFVKLVASLATGHSAAPLVASSDPKELQKELSAAAFEGKPILNLNNLTFDLESALLCQMVTEGLIEIRPFGRNDITLTCDCRATTVFANGNNVRVVGDLVRRTLTARMDARMERPELRKFRGDPVASVIGDRGKYVAAIFTIARAYLNSPMVEGGESVAGFEAWAKMVQQPIIWLGWADPMRAMDDARKLDPERSALRERIDALANSVGVGIEFTPARVHSLATQPSEGDMRKFKFPDLLDAYSKDGRTLSAKSIGRQMMRDRGRVANDLSIELVKSDEKSTNSYKLVRQSTGGENDREGFQDF